MILKTLKFNHKDLKLNSKFLFLFYSKEFLVLIEPFWNQNNIAS